MATKTVNNNISKNVGMMSVRINWKITNGIINCAQTLRQVLNQGWYLNLLKFLFTDNPPFTNLAYIFFMYIPQVRRTLQKNGI